MLEKISSKHKIYGSIGVAIIGILVVMAFFWLDSDEKKSKVAITPVKLFVVGESDKAFSHEWAGEIKSLYETDLAFQTSGKVLYRKVKVGDHVCQGDVIAVLDSRDLEQTVRNTKAQEASARSQLRLAEKNMQRFNALMNAGAVSEATYDQYVQQYEAAEATVEQAQAQAEQSTNQLGYSMLLADRDGVVTKMKLESGQVVSAGETVATLADENNLVIEASVPESDMKNIEIGNKLKANLWSDGKTPYDAVICEVSPIADNETRTYKVKAQLQGDLTKVRIGITAKSYMEKETNPAIYIPVAAIIEQPSNGKGVWLVKDGKVHFLKIELGQLIKEQVEVLSGLSLGEKIVAAGVQQLHEGQLVGGSKD